MGYYNRVVLMGNVTRPLELRYTPAGTAVTDLGMAMNDRRKSQTGEWIEETVFVDVTLWGRTAEVASQYLQKGSPVFIEGRLKFDTWESDGQKRSRLRVVGERMQLIGTRGGGGGGNDRPPQRQYDESEYSRPTHSEDSYGSPSPAGSSPAGSSAPTGVPPSNSGESEDEIPF